ncbi:antirestriction protein [Pantoea sp. DY-5]|uniref:antirestriction protein n=1 Tax=Pantoea sp. DY-5 TaxID=2871488 RepID=UPI001C9822B5|nr:antirestriction protein [Pantoea sp. DY-5]MBY4841163.1 antirestriction protein [Pantoea sp. DY-5]
MNTALHAPLAARFLDGFVKLRFLPSLFGDDFMRAENNVYLYAARYMTNYNGGEWTFVHLEQGGGYMIPPDGTWRFENPENWSVAEVSADAAGIIITALVLNHRSWMYDRHDEEELCALFCRRHRQLMVWAETHSEAAAIFRALD